MDTEDGTIEHIQGVGMCTSRVREGCTELPGRSSGHNAQFHRQLARCCVEIVNGFTVVWRVRIPHDCHPANARKSFLKQLQSLGAKFSYHIRDAGDVAARMR